MPTSDVLPARLAGCGHSLRPFARGGGLAFSSIVADRWRLSRRAAQLDCKAGCSLYTQHLDLYMCTHMRPPEASHRPSADSPFSFCDRRVSKAGHAGAAGGSSCDWRMASGYRGAGICRVQASGHLLVFAALAWQTLSLHSRNYVFGYHHRSVRLRLDASGRHSTS